jgi:glyoxylase-like metal-dependent hydrolase (beta-lactamase superfamily II)
MKRLILSLAASLAFTTSQSPAQDTPVEYETTKLSDSVTMIKARGGNIAVSAGEDGVFVIDDQLKPNAEQLLAAIGAVSDAPIRFVINTHYHGDHVGGNEAIGDMGAVVIAHDKIRERMTSEQFSHFMDSTTPPWPAGALPVVTFNDRVTLHLNGEAVAVHHVPRGHTDGDSIVFFPDSNVLHMGDIYFNGLYPYIDLDGGGSVQGMIAAVAEGIALADAETRIIPGHGPLSNLGELEAYHSMLVEIRDTVQALIDDGKSLQEVVDARPSARWDDTLGKVWITPGNLAVFVYNSLKGIDRYTPPEGSTTE